MVYRTTLAPLVTIRREMDRIFDDAFGTQEGATSWIPVADVREEEQAFVFELELPGVDPATVEVTADQGVLRVSGEKQSSRSDETPQRWHVFERVAGRFARSFRLPSTVNEEQIHASFAHGLLTVRAAKAEVPKARRIEVQLKNG